MEAAFNKTQLIHYLASWVSNGVANDCYEFRNKAWLLFCLFGLVKPSSVARDLVAKDTLNLSLRRRHPPVAISGSSIETPQMCNPGRTFLGKIRYFDVNMWICSMPTCRAGRRCAGKDCEFAIIAVFEGQDCNC